MASASPVPGWIPADLPASAGVYEFRDEGGRALYVGKSVNLRRRVRSYFYGNGPDDDRLAEMLRLARSVRVRRTGSDLEARLEEAERILRGTPPYNRALKRRWRGWYLEIPWRDPFPRLRLVRSPRRRRSRYFGPFWSRRPADRLRRLTEKLFRLRSCAGALRPDPAGSACIQRELGLCSAPCIARTGLAAYREQVRAAERLLRDPSFGERMRARIAADRDEAASRMAYEEAAAHQRRLAWLEEIEEARWLLERGRLERSWLIVLPSTEAGRRVLLPVARGRVLPRRDVAWRRGPRETAVADACYRVRVAELGAPSVLPPRDLTTAVMVSRWIEEGAEGGTLLDLDRLDAEGALRRLAPTL